ncbi:hypothetical protein [Streptacidiphilus melanogenes]|uniref:hypothetical protein n=1 Tax=Streptacidiphilus melanogenes TaxID=411235 RepID=UPI0005AB151C|nr:hypothetical protein [Streptacidiphilus melanogenes]
MTGDTSFAARTGHEPPEQAPEGRARQVAQAWESVLQIRRLVQPDHPDLPAPWERAQQVRAVALALEAAGVPLCAFDGDVVVMSGAVVEAEAHTGTGVTWRYQRGQRAADAGEADLGTAADALRRAGWDALLYRAGRSRYLLVEPGRST